MPYILSYMMVLSQLSGMCPGLAEWWLHQPLVSTLGGGRTVREAHSEHAKHALLLGGSGGMPPQENFEKLTL